MVMASGGCIGGERSACGGKEGTKARLVGRQLCCCEPATIMMGDSLSSHSLGVLRFDRQAGSGAMALSRLTRRHGDRDSASAANSSACVGSSRYGRCAITCNHFTEVHSLRWVRVEGSIAWKEGRQNRQKRVTEVLIVIFIISSARIL